MKRFRAYIPASIPVFIDAKDISSARQKAKRLEGLDLAAHYGGHLLFGEINVVGVAHLGKFSDERIEEVDNE